MPSLQNILLLLIAMGLLLLAGTAIWGVRVLAQLRDSREASSQQSGVFLDEGQLATLILNITDAAMRGTYQGNMASLTQSGIIELINYWLAYEDGDSGARHIDNRT